MLSAVFLKDEDVDAILRSTSGFPHFRSRRELVRWKTRLQTNASSDFGRWQTCSVVGSSGSLLRRQHGGAIDEADAVIRVNSAPIYGLSLIHI